MENFQVLISMPAQIGDGDDRGAFVRAHPS